MTEEKKESEEKKDEKKEETEGKKYEGGAIPKAPKTSSSKE